MLIKNFAAQGQMVFYLKKPLCRCQAKLVYPAQIFYELDSNAYSSADGIKRTEIEDQLSCIESKTDKILQKIIRSVHENRIPQLSHVEKLQLAEFSLTLFKRSPTIRATYATREAASEMLQEFISDLEYMGIRLSKELQARFATPIWQHSALKQASVKATLLHQDKLLQDFSKKAILYSRPRNSKKSFVLGSLPVVRLRGEAHEGIADRLSEYWLPISPKLALAWYGVSESDSFLELEDRQMRYLNLVAWRQSTGAVSSSVELLKSLSLAR